MNSPRALRTVEDTGLMERAREGDLYAFEELYRRYNRKLLDFFYGMCRDVQSAEDLRNETFMRIWGLRKRYEPKGTFAAYVFTIARLIWLEHCRRQGKQWRLGVRDDDLLAQDRLASSSGTPPDQAAWRDELETGIVSAVDTLPEEQRMVFMLRMVRGLSLDEIARIMECPVNTVRSRKILAVRKLRALLGSWIRDL